MNNDSFFSMDRLMEFGLSMAMAQQMVQTMNQSMQNMYVPGSAANLQGTAGAAPVLFYAVLEGKQAGPFSESELTRLIATKQLTKETMVWRPGMTAWTAAEQIPEVLRLVSLTPPDISQTADMEEE